VPADRETVAAVERTLQEDEACLVAGDILRTAALRTDRYFVRLLATEGPLTDDQLATVEAGVPDESGGFGWQPLPGSPVLVLPDGRVGVLVEPGVSAGFEWSPDAGLMLVFARVGDRLLIDEEITVTRSAMDAALTPTPVPRATASPTPHVAQVAPSRTPTTRVVVRDIDLDVANVTPASTEESPASTVTDSATNSAAVTALLRVGEDGATLREEPSTQSPIVAALDRAHLLEPSGPPVDTDGGVWWPVKSVQTGDAGYVRDQDVAIMESDMAVAEEEVLPDAAAYPTVTPLPSNGEMAMPATPNVATP
jgi:hypothetical protein